MKGKIKKIKISKSQVILMIIFSAITVVLSLGTSYAANVYLYDSKDVSYDNTNSGIVATDVQGAVDELYDAATDYSEIKNYFKNNPTGYFDGAWINSVSSENDRGFKIFDSTIKKGSLFYRESDDTLYLEASGDSGNSGQGILNIKADSVKINDVDIENFMSQIDGSLNTSISNDGNTLNVPDGVDLNRVLFRWGMMNTISNPPSGLGGNACLLIQGGSGNYMIQMAIGFGSTKIALRNKHNSSTWSTWKYITAS